MESDKKYKAGNDALKISLIADNPSAAMKEFIDNVDQNLDKYYRIIDEIIDNNIGERHKKAWLKLAEM